MLSRVVFESPETKVSWSVSPAFAVFETVAEYVESVAPLSVVLAHEACELVAVVVL